MLTQWLCDVRLLFDIPRQAFVPAPKVTSTVVQLVPRATPLAACDQALLERVTAAAFGQRRKMLRQSLKSLGGDTAALIAAAGVGADRARRGIIGRAILRAGTGTRRRG